MKVWSLYNEEEKLRIDDLTVEQVKIVMLAISKRRMHEWYACPQGRMDWQPINEVEEFKQEVTQVQNEAIPLKKAVGGDVAPAHSPVPTHKAKLAVAKDDGRSAPTLMVDLSQTKERRSARRYTREWNFNCTIGDKVFSCRTVDVSMSGLSLTAELPKWVPKVFKAEVTLAGHTAEILCEKVSAKKIKISDANNWDLLRRGIVNF